MILMAPSLPDLAASKAFIVSSNLNLCKDNCRLILAHFESLFRIDLCVMRGLTLTLPPATMAMAFG